MFRSQGRESLVFFSHDVYGRFFSSTQLSGICTPVGQVSLTRAQLFVMSMCMSIYHLRYEVMCKQMDSEFLEELYKSELCWCDTKAMLLNLASLSQI